MWLAYCERLRDFCAANPDVAIVVPHRALVNGWPLAEALRQRWAVELGTDPADLVKPEYVRLSVGESVQEFLTPLSTARLDAVWQGLIALIPSALRDEADEPVSWEPSRRHPLLPEMWQAASRMSPAPRVAAGRPAEPLPSDRQAWLDRLTGSTPPSPGLHRHALDWALTHAAADGPLLHRLAARALDDGEPAVAERAALGAVAAAPSEPGPQLLLGQAEARLLRPDAAEHHLRLAVHLSTADGGALGALGAFLRSQGRTDEAFDVLFYAREHHPAVWPLAVLAEMLIDHERNDEALTTLERAEILHPEARDRWLDLQVRVWMSVDPGRGAALAAERAVRSLRSAHLPRLVRGWLEEIHQRSLADDLLSRVAECWSDLLGEEACRQMLEVQR
jgi:tetratricopeptide (TPR) repeat protein